MCRPRRRPRTARSSLRYLRASDVDAVHIACGGHRDPSGADVGDHQAGGTAPGVADAAAAGDDSREGVAGAHDDVGLLRSELAAIGASVVEDPLAGTACVATVHAQWRQQAAVIGAHGELAITQELDVLDDATPSSPPAAATGI